ncbi:MAG TPA: glycosyltransferase family 4 protein [Candidatus Dormibacteraeota bacterium]|jgi:glycosyltransferase involved in cell wall biosynthesis|nr:glycosyltransferase family 4 protein [Candidatus Dormibacteraeota bacterium]
MTPRTLMLVSAAAQPPLRREVAEGHRPRPEYLLLEAEYGVELFDWSRLPRADGSRSPARSLIHSAAAMRKLDGHDVVFSDGEHVGVPMAMAMRVLGERRPHLVIGHHLTARGKAPLIKALGAHRGMTRVLVHSRRQRELVSRRAGIPPAKVDYVPYGVDTAFWTPAASATGTEPLVVSAGREHRDFATLAAACEQLPVRVFVASGSVHSPAASSAVPQRWPANFESGFAGYADLRDLYRRASVVVVPLLETDFQAGVTTVLEAMAAGKPVVVTSTSGQSDVIVDGETGVFVRPEDPIAMRDAIRRLLDSPDERLRLGANAREAVATQFAVEAYAGRLAEHLAEVASAN